MKRTIEEALKRASFCLRAAGIENPRTEAELLLAHILKLDRLRLVNTRTDLLAESDTKKYEEALKRRVKQEPLAYITGEKYFYGRPFIIKRDVLIPRPETELLVDLALGWANNKADLRPGGLRILDLGTGSGVLAITLALELPSAEVWAIDTAPAALMLAGQNASRYSLGKRIKFLQSSYFNPLDSLHSPPRFNLIVSNPPYISATELAELPTSVIKFEPGEALYGGADGLGSYRAILKYMPFYVTPQAFFVVEIGSTQAPEVIALFKDSGLFRLIGCRRDLAKHPRAIFGLI